MARLKRPLAQAPPRQRILHAARDLFYREGINAVSVEAIAATAGTNKMTLYRHFSSRDELVAAYLTELAAEGEGVWEAARAAHPGDPDAQLRFLLRQVSQFAAQSSGRGCALANAAVELADKDHPARKVIEEFKRAQRDRLIRLCQATGLAQPELLIEVEGMAALG